MDLEFAQMIDGVQAVVLMCRHKVPSEVKDDELGQTPEVTHLSYPLYLIPPAVQLHQRNQARQACTPPQCSCIKDTKMTVLQIMFARQRRDEQQRTICCTFQETWTH